ncbi:hypothetical protein JYT30_00940, partial [Desulfotalea psychrophila]|nr:hypothetical protein [Desulfotalea psychrophila]
AWQIADPPNNIAAVTAADWIYFPDLNFMILSWCLIYQKFINQKSPCHIDKGFSVLDLPNQCKITLFVAIIFPVTTHCD